LSDDTKDTNYSKALSKVVQRTDQTMPGFLLEVNLTIKSQDRTQPKSTANFNAGGPIAATSIKHGRL
jgi:uncharacterized protein YabE (DUF348 family)